MNVIIFGHHPDLYPGFNSLMTANFAYGFAKSGYSVTVVLPETSEHRQEAKLTSLGLKIENLDMFDVEVEFRIVGPSDDMGQYDLGVWQSYFPQDEAFFPQFRRAARVITKNFPRLLTGDSIRDQRTLAGTANRFDIVGLALNSDKLIADGLVGSIPDAVSRSIYMPRGFRADWFKPAELSGVPIFGIERGVDADSSEYAYLIPVLKRLRSEFGNINVIGARLNDSAITTSTIGLLPPRQFYSEFLNPLWAYLMIDVSKSRQGMNAIKVEDRVIYPGVYENQVIEAQHAGAAVVGQEDALPQELVASNRVALRFDNFSDTIEIFNFLANVIENRYSVASEAKQWAKENHSVSNMIKPLLNAL